MGLMDKLKGLFKGREKQVKSGIDTVSDKVEKAVGRSTRRRSTTSSDKAKDAVDKLAGTDQPAARDAAAGDPPPQPSAAGRRRRHPSPATPSRRPRRRDPDATRGATSCVAPTLCALERLSPCRSACP